MVLYSKLSSLAFKIIFFIFAVIEVLLLSGITYGWASIATIFRQRGFFSYLCNIDTFETKNVTRNSSLVSHNSESMEHDATIAVCSLQRKRLNLILNVSLAFLCGAKFPIGLFIDYFGPRAGELVGW